VLQEQREPACSQTFCLLQQDRIERRRTLAISSIGWDRCRKRAPGHVARSEYLGDHNQRPVARTRARPA
jgi:hypothetical protein